MSDTVTSSDNSNAMFDNSKMLNVTTPEIDDDLKTWNLKDFFYWLRENLLAEYIPVFKFNEVTIQWLIALSDPIDLRPVGVLNENHRRKIFVDFVVAKLNANENKNRVSSTKATQSLPSVTQASPQSFTQVSSTQSLPSAPQGEQAVPIPRWPLESKKMCSSTVTTTTSLHESSSDLDSPTSQPGSRRPASPGSDSDSPDSQPGSTGPGPNVCEICGICSSSMSLHFRGHFPIPIGEKWCFRCYTVITTPFCLVCGSQSQDFDTDDA